MNSTFKIISEIKDMSTIGYGRGVDVRSRLNRVYGRGRWRKTKGTATVELPDRTVCEAEIHWYEAHGTGRREFKIKRIIKWVSLLSALVTRVIPQTSLLVKSTAGCRTRTQSRTICSGS